MAHTTIVSLNASKSTLFTRIDFFKNKENINVVTHDAIMWETVNKLPSENRIYVF